MNDAAEGSSRALSSSLTCNVTFPLREKRRAAIEEILVEATSPFSMTASCFTRVYRRGLTKPKKANAANIACRAELGSHTADDKLLRYLALTMKTAEEAGDYLYREDILKMRTELTTFAAGRYRGYFITDE